MPEKVSPNTSKGKASVKQKSPLATLVPLDQEEVKRLSSKIEKLKNTSNDFYFSEEQLDEILGPLTTIQENLTNLKSSFLKENEPLTMMIGDSQNGKTTAIHFAFHPEPLRVTKKGRLEHPHPFPGTSIGEGVTSCTLFPTFILTDQHGVVVDMPGPNDSRGAFYQLVIHLCYSVIMSGGTPLKFVFVQRHPNATTLFQPFIERANLDFFESDNTAILYTSAPRLFLTAKEVTEEYLPHKADIPSYSIYCPESPAEDYASVHNDTKNQILKCLSGLRPKSVTYSAKLSDSVLLLLQQFRDSAINVLQKTLGEEVCSVIRSGRVSTPFLKVEALMEELKTVKQRSFKEFLIWLNTAGFDLPCARFQKYLDQIGVLNSLLNLQDPVFVGSGWIHENQKSSFEDWKAHVSDISRVKTGYMHTEFDESSQTFYFSGFNLRLSKIIDHVDLVCVRQELEAKKPTGKFPKLILIAFDTLIIDRGVNHWLDIEVCAETLLFEGDHHFDLSSKCTTQNLEEAKAQQGSPGKRGLPGAPGGSLILRFTNLKVVVDSDGTVKSMDPKQIQFLSKGQKGGKGQNAFDATDGVDALLSDNQKSEFLRNVIQVFWDNTTIYGASHRPQSPPRYKEVSKACSRISKSGPHHVEAEIFALDYTMELDGPLGTPGIDSGLRGAGGYGGLGGKLMVKDNTETCLFEIQGQKGDSGEPGDPGLPSQGGRAADTVTYSTRFNFVDEGKSNGVIGGLTALAVLTFGGAAAAIAAYIGGISLSANNKNADSNREVKYITSQRRNRGGISIQSIKDDDKGVLPQETPKLSSMESAAIRLHEAAAMLNEFPEYDFSEVI